MNLLTQSDLRWRHIKLANTNSTIGSCGCVITAVANIYNLYKGMEMTNPTILNRDLDFTRSGDLLWASVERELGCKVIWDNKNPKPEQFNIVKFNFLGSPHFTNLLTFYNDKYVIYDVYDDEVKIKDKDDILRVTTLIFPEEGECECCKIKF
jgi:hypothetical protein